MSAPTDAGTYDSDYNSFVVVGGDQSATYDSLAKNYVAYGGHIGQLFYESYTLTAEATILYAWARDNKNEKVSTKPESAICVKMIEI
jgi:hypothetical protein